MAVEPTEDVRTRLEGSGWIPIRELGSGGGGVVLLCANQRVLAAIDSYAEASVDPPGGEMSRLERVLGAARDNDGIAAVKLPRLDSGHPEDQERFRREVEATEQYIHPALIRFIERDRRAVPTWFAMEYHPRGTLAEPANRPKYLGEPLAILADLRPVAEALGLVHRGGAVHRDVKPRNIFVAENGNLVLGDFGIVAPAPEADRLTTIEPAHSRDWVPDWVQFGEERKYTTSVDVFAIAKVMYYLLAGENVMASQLNHAAEVIRERFSGVRGIAATLALLEKCIVDREDKCTITNGAALVLEIENILAAESVAPPKQLVFSCLSTHASTDMELSKMGELQDGDQLPEVTRLSRIQVLLSRPTERLMGRARVRGSGGIMQVEIGGVLSQRIEIPNSAITGSEVWTDELIVHARTPLIPGWHELVVRGSGNRVFVSGLVLYAA
jgi:serine/threonine protein kinase